MSLLRRAQLRSQLRERGQLGLALLGIAVGVAVVVAVDLVNASSREAMRIARDELSGAATHRITGPGDRLDERLWPGLRARARASSGPLADVEAMVPVVEGDALLVLADGATRPLRVLGVDVVSDAAVRAFVAAPGQEVASGEDPGGDRSEDGDRQPAVGPGALLTDPEAVALDADSAAIAGLVPGDRFVVRTALGDQDLRLVATLPATDGRVGAGVLLADIATAQERLGRLGWLSRIDVVGAGAPDAGSVAAFVERLFPGLVVPPEAAPVDVGDGLRLVPVADEVADTRALASSFQLNLAAMSLLALVVGLFLIHGTLRFSLLRRQRQFGVLRALGVTPTELRRAVLLEAALLGLVGALAGLALGRVLAGGLLGLVSATLAGLYEQVAVGALTADPVPYLKGLAVGLGGAVLVTLPLADRAARIPPRALELGALATPRSTGSALRLAAVFAGLGALAAVPGTGYLGGLLAVAGLLLAGAVLAPAGVAAVLRGVGALAARAPVGRRLLLREASRGVRRSGVAPAALVVAVATAVGMTLMVESFRGSVEDWLEGRLGAPVYLRLPEGAAAPAGLAARIDARAAGVVERRAFDDRAERGPRSAPVTVSLAQVRGTVPDNLGLSLVGGAWDGRGALVSEPLARRLDLLDARPEAPRELRIAGLGEAVPVHGVFREYGAARGTVVLPAVRWPAPPPGVRTFELHGVDAVPATVSALAEDLPAGAGVRRNDEILAISLDVFDRTFRVTAVLQTLAGVVAAFALFGALAALTLERRAQYGVLRTLGVDRRTPALQAVGESVLVAGAAGVLALPLGVLVAWVLVAVVNVRAFGWSLDFTMRPGVFVEALAVALGAGVLAALLPARSLWRATPRAMLADARALG